jgi:hypothetical protein
MNWVMTRSAYGPEWDREANARRLAITRAVTARLMAQQTADFSWIVLLDNRDPFLNDRMDLYAKSCPAFYPLIWSSGPETTRKDKADRMPNWRIFVKPREPALMTRLDDDDGFAPDALERYQRAAAKLTERTVLILPGGIRYFAGFEVAVRHERNAMQSLYTPPGDTLSPYDYTHTDPPAPVWIVDSGPSWLWVRHEDSISGEDMNAAYPLTDATRRHFPVDWSAI